MADAGVVVLVPLISPYRSGRDEARAIHAEARLPFVEVYVDTPLELCEERDPKGLYKLARARLIQHFTGLDDASEPHTRPQATLSPDDGTTHARPHRVPDPGPQTPANAHHTPAPAGP